MKLIIKYIAIILFLILFVIPFRSVSAATSGEIGERISKDTDVITRLLKHFNDLGDTKEDIQAVIEETNSFQSYFIESANYFENLFLKESDESTKILLNKFNINSNQLSVDAKTLLTSIENGDETKITDSYSNLYSHSIDERDKLIEEYNQHFNLVDYGNTFIWLLIITGLISVVLFIWSRGSPILPSEKLNKELKQALFRSSLWPLGGAAITYAGYAYTPSGGEFYILYGPIIFGAYQFIKGLYYYQRYAKPAIILAKKEEQGKLDELLTSDSFKHEDLKKKLDDLKELRYESLEKLKHDESDDLLVCLNCGRKFLSNKKHCPYCHIPLTIKKEE